MSGAGDINSDGLDDLIVGAPYADAPGNGAGRSYVVFGMAGMAAVDLSDIAAGTGGFVLNGEVANDRSGCPASGAGDVNNDGVDDLVVGARLADPNGESSGRTYVVFGVPTTL
ncbi:MAG: integrin alpha [Myxococcota bacterium]